MMYYDHAMVGATLAIAVGAQRRHGWSIVVMAALAGMCPDWDALAQYHSREAYQIAHRFWGHNLFVVTLAGVVLGAVGYLIHQSKAGRRAEGTDPPRSGLGFWIVLGVLILWTHPLLDLLYCGLDRNLDWPVGLLWPVVPGGVGMPWMPWSDWGATGILVGGLLLVLGVQSHRQGWACVVLSILGLYVGVRGVMLRWG
jgi:hypothetical protein